MSIAQEIIINMAYIKKKARTTMVLFVISVCIKSFSPVSSLKVVGVLLDTGSVAMESILRFHNKAKSDFQIIVELESKENEEWVNKNSKLPIIWFNTFLPSFYLCYKYDSTVVL